MITTLGRFFRSPSESPSTNSDARDINVNQSNASVTTAVVYTRFISYSRMEISEWCIVFNDERSDGKLKHTDTMERRKFSTIQTHSKEC